MYRRYTSGHEIITSGAMNNNVGVVDQLMFLRRSGRVRRYHTEELLKPQDVAQHSYGVAWLCWQLTSGAAQADLIMHALAHDAAEHATGDIPSPTKRALGIRSEVDRIEYGLLCHNGIELPPLAAHDEAVLKLADTLDGVLHCLHERELGNRTLTQVFANYTAYAAELIPPDCGPGDHSVMGRARQILNYAKERWNDIESK
jgi:5'-deoxynucleotidase YfbR-like HD superfamily hydrolase